MAEQRDADHEGTCQPDGKRRSTEVRLGLVSMVAMAGGLGLLAWVATTPSKESRPLYASRDDCEREWSDRDCEPNSSGSGAGVYSNGGYRGPFVSGYTVDEAGKAHPSNMQSDVVPGNSRALTLQRGGFGSTGGWFGASS